MFIQQKNNAIYRVSLTLDRVLAPFWDLTKNLLKSRLLTERVYTLFDTSFEQGKAERMQRCEELFQKNCEEINQSEGSEEEKQQAIEKEERCMYDTVFAEAFQLILNYFLHKILSPECFRKQIKKSCSLIIYKSEGECRFVAEGTAEDRFDKEFRNCLFSMKVVEEFLCFLNGGDVNSNSFNPKIYAYIFPDHFEDDAVSIASSNYSKEIIEAKEIVVRQPSMYQIWYNEQCLKSFGYNGSHEGDVYEYIVDETLVALEQGDYIIPLVTEWQTYFNVTNQAQLIWTDFQNQIYNIERRDNKKQKPAKLTMTNDEKAFVEAATSEDFTNILSHLVDNLYLPDDAPAVAETYQKFFHPLKKVEELKHLVDYKIYVPDQDQEGTVLGVYKINKLEGESDYNLRHMLYTQQVGDKQVIKDYNDEQRNVTTVQVLKPQYASFYMMDYYEFFVEEVLKSLKERGIINGYLRNQRYCYKGQGGNKMIEIDALVYNGQKIFLFELKTTLHIEFLNTYPQRYAALLAEETMPEIYSFHLVSSFAEDNIAVLNMAPKDGYNTVRKGLKTIPYKFDIAIPGTGNKLHCLSESSFNKLKAELQLVFTA
jgi:hypothetical protein